MSEFSINHIRNLLPHRYPFLLIDRIIECEPGKRLVALKNVTVNEPFFQGHFPGRPVMPGVLIMEAMAQATGLLAFHTAPEKVNRDTLYLFAGMDNVRFKRQVEPGDQIVFEVELNRIKRGIWMCSGEATVDGKVVASGDLMGVMRDIGGDS
ncbi:MAG: 3-hydroxyacyl-ACP dehydratase FabZ [Gammaproteobacteria bacterium]